MSSLLQSLCKLSQSLFSKTTSSKTEQHFEEASSKLAALFCQLTLKDLHLTPKDLSYDSAKRPYIPQAPISFVDVVTVKDSFSLTIFGLRQSASIIPLHDHPGMHAFMRCIYGSVVVKSYSIVENVDCQIPPEIRKRINGRFHDHQIVPAVCLGEEILSSDNPRVCTLTPHTKNLHEIKPVSSGLAVIADIITPPYTTATESFFYEIIDTIYDLKLNQSITWLLKTTDCGYYYCDTVQYTGPRIKV